MYAYPTLQMAERGNYGRGKFHKDNLVAIGPASENFRCEVYDSNWVTDFDSLPIDTASRYWNQEMTREPLTECLLSGRFWILGTTVRKRAYETIKRVWPNSLTLLELSRLAAGFGSDLGSTSPWLRREGNRVIVSSIIKYSTEEGLDVWRRALEEKKRNPSFPMNWADLKPLCKPGPDPELDAKFCVPDGRSYEYELRQDKVEELNQFTNLVLQQK